MRWLRLVGLLGLLLVGIVAVAAYLGYDQLRRPFRGYAGEEITADYEPGTREEVTMPDGSTLRLRKLDENYDPHDLARSLGYINEHRIAGEVLTGLLYLDPDASDCHEILGTVDTPLNELNEAELCPGNEALAAINESFR